MAEGSNNSGFVTTSRLPPARRLICSGQRQGPGEPPVVNQGLPSARIPRYPASSPGAHWNPMEPQEIPFDIYYN